MNKLSNVLVASRSAPPPPAEAAPEAPEAPEASEEPSDDTGGWFGFGRSIDLDRAYTGYYGNGERRHGRKNGRNRK